MLKLPSLSRSVKLKSFSENKYFSSSLTVIVFEDVVGASFTPVTVIISVAVFVLVPSEIV